MAIVAYRDGVHLVSSDWLNVRTAWSFDTAYEQVRKWRAGRTVVTEVSNSEGYFRQHNGMLSSHDFTQVLKRAKRSIAWTAITVQVETRTDETRPFPWITAFVAPNVEQLKGEEDVPA